MNNQQGKTINVKKKQINIADQLLNIMWSTICFTPIVMYWTDLVAQKWLYVFVFSGIVTIFMPKGVLYKLRFSGRRNFYENRGVKTFRKLVQEGNHRWATKTKIKNVTNKMEAIRFLGKTDMYERFHWGCLIFFLFSSLHCFVHGKLIYGILITAANAVYNIPTILLQQYNRLRIEAMLEREEK